MFTKKNYVEELFREMRPNYEMSQDQETETIYILNHINWDEIRGFRKIITDVFHGVLDDDKIPYIMSLHDEIRRKYCVMADEETIEKEKEIGKNKIRETDWDSIPPWEYRNYIDRIAYEATKKIIHKE